MIKYIGSKRKLLPQILLAIRAVPAATTVVDLFSGTSRVGHALKRAGYRVYANDHNAYAHALARCYVEIDAEDVNADAQGLIDELNTIPGNPGAFTSTYCEQARFFHPKNGARIEAIRNAIANYRLSPDLETVALVSLMEAADRVDSTTGVQMAYLKQWAPRAHDDLHLRVPDVLPRATHGKGAASCRDAVEAVGDLPCDILYLDPPYNQHSYLGNYHIWESLIRWDHLPVYGVARKRVDCRERKSRFNSRPGSFPALRDLLGKSCAKTVIVSFSNEGFVSREEMEAALSELWGNTANVYTIQIDYRRYVGAQIGIHDPRGVRVGNVSHLRNTEFIYVASVIDLSASLAPLLSASHD